MSNLLAESRELQPRILFEPIPSVDRFLAPLIYSMREGKTVTLDYQGFSMRSAAPHDVEPYALKLYKQRWYLLGRRPERDVMRIFALDRVTDITVTDRPFLLPDTFNAESYFEDSVGIWVEENCSPQTVTLFASGAAQGHLRSIPIHHSQQEYRTTAAGSKFRLFVRPNDDLVKDLLRFGADVQVLSPAWFRKKIEGVINEMARSYLQTDMQETDRRQTINMEMSVPKAITEQDLIRLCAAYRDSIGSGVFNVPKPDIRVRYVIDRDRFGYAEFGDFFMIETGDMYVWTDEEQFAEAHNQDMLDGCFYNQCKRTGYFHRVIFAGVRTGFHDTNREDIYTGDVIDLNGQYSDRPFALGTLGWNEDDMEARYAFVLDNHCILPEECSRMTRVGTVFYRLDWNDCVEIRDRCYGFQPWFSNDIPLEDLTVMAKYTPNFDQEIWKYRACDILGIEFDWH